MVLLHFFRTLEKVLGGNGEKFLVAHGCITVDIGLPFLDFSDFALHQIEPRQDVLTPYDDLGNSVDLAVHFVNEVNELVNGRVVAVFLLRKPLAQRIPAKKHFPV